MMRRSLFVPLCATLVACAADLDPAELTDVNLMGLNGLAPSLLEDSLPAINELAAEALDGALTELVETASGQKALSYVGRCALAAGETATLPLPLATGGVHLVHGQFGFASEWLDQPLSDIGKQWVTACVLAHVNAFSINVVFSARATVLGIPTPDDVAQFSIQEGSFSGNFFAADPADRKTYACFGSAVAEAFGNDGDANPNVPGGWVDRRVCTFGSAGPSLCKIDNAGPCWLYGPPTVGTPTHSCGTDVDSSTAYSDCQEEPIEEGVTAQLPSVSTYLSPDGFDEWKEEFLALEGCTVTEAGPVEGGPADGDPLDAGTFTWQGEIQVRSALACDVATVLD